MRVLSVLPPRDGCVGGSLDPVLGVFILQLFGGSVLQRPYTVKNRIKHKSQSLLKVLQSLLHLPEQEQFVKTPAFLHERVTNYK